jgi:long-chain fatty acid transport protein
VARRTIIALVALALGAPVLAQASGLALPARGVRALAMGGAFVAGADDPSALWVNPANLALLGGTRIMADAGVIGTSATFARTGFDPVFNEAPPVVDPSVFVTSDFGTRSFTFGLGVFAPYGANVRFPYEGPQRYSLISNVGTSVLYVGAGAAWQPHPRLRVGVAFENAIVNARFAKAASGQHILGGVEDREWDLLAQLRMTSAFNPTVGLGLWYNPWGGIELGFSMQTPISVSGEGQIRLRPLLDNPNPTFDPTHQAGDRVRLSFELPMILRGGLRYNARGRWDVEAAVSFERWSTHRQILMQPIDVYLLDYPGLDAYRIKDETFVRNWRNTVAFSLGGSGRVSDWLRLRGGYFFEPPAVPDETASVEAIDADKHGFGVGASFVWKRLGIDLMYSHVFLMDRTITNSQVRQTNPIDAGRTTVVGNGVYRGGFDIFGIAVQYVF